MRLNEEIALVASKTGWPLEYIRALPLYQLNNLTAELIYQEQLSRYQEAYNSALIVCTLASDKSHHYKPEEIIGHVPERRVMESNDLAKPPKIDTITLANGQEYKLAPLTANIMADLEDKFDKSIDELFGKSLRMKVFRALVYARLKPNYPDMTEEQVGDLLTDDVMVNFRKNIGL